MRLEQVADEPVIERLETAGEREIALRTLLRTSR